MSGKLTKRRSRKIKMSEKVKRDKVERQQRRLAIKQLPIEQQKEVLAADKRAHKMEQLNERREIKALPKKERNERKKEAKVYRKIKNRPRRLIIWSAVALAVVGVTIKVGPTAAHMYTIMSGKNIVINTETVAGEQARAVGKKISREIAAEGITLLKNESDNLPLKDARVNVFGTAAFNFRYGGGGSGGIDTSAAVNLFDGLKQADVSYNQTLRQFYEDLPEVKQAQATKNESGMMQVVKSMLSGTDEDEPTIDYLKKDVIKQAQAYSDNAVILLASSGVESSDMSQKQLQMTKNKRVLIQTVAANFDNITVVVNAGNALELGYLEEFPQIKSIVWVGTPGPYGTEALGDVLAGKVNPSGRLTDTYAYDSQSAPATENFGDYKYSNLKQSYVNYQEGIYIGYRFYETYYKDDEVGYHKAVQFPYGHGLSYTDFDWKIVDKQLNEDKITVKVAVTNTGKQAGKDVVQLYYSAPYTKGGLEKSAVVLGAFGKTKLLQPGQKQTLTLSYATNDMASYDSGKAEGYVLDKGDYQLKLAKNVHDSTLGFTYKVPKTKVVKTDSATGTTIKNQFEASEAGLTYLSRSDWKGTYPSDKERDDKAPQFVLDELAKQPTDSKLPLPKFEQDNQLQLADLKGLAYDDPKWELFLDQFTKEELIDYVVNGAYETKAIERLGVPSAMLLDGPAGLNSFFKKFKAASYPSENVLAATWNEQLGYDMGEAIGKEAKVYGVHGWYAPAVNLHRTAMGGRNFEYFSEDPVLSGKMGAAVIKGAQEQDIIVFMKHFAMNDQETNARSGLYVWGNEQSIRELHLRPFEIAVKEGKTLGTMSSFSLINGKWAGGNSELLNNVLRDEWGFEGVVSSDAVFGFMHADDAIVAGNDLMLDTMSAPKNVKRIKTAYESDPSGTAVGLRTSVHNIMYALLQTYLIK